VVTSAVHLYSKAFNSNGRGRSLDGNKYFVGASATITCAHKFFRNFRNEFFAHAESLINEHLLYVIPASDGLRPQVSPRSQVGRRLLYESYNWSQLEQAAQYVCGQVSADIIKISIKLQDKLSIIQVSRINALNPHANATYL
jgi:hypothetical protein